MKENDMEIHKNRSLAKFITRLYTIHAMSTTDTYILSLDSVVFDVNTKLYRRIHVSCKVCWMHRNVHRMVYAFKSMWSIKKREKGTQHISSSIRYKHYAKRRGKEFLSDCNPLSNVMDRQAGMREARKSSRE